MRIGHLGLVLVCLLMIFGWAEAALAQNARGACCKPDGSCVLVRRLRCVNQLQGTFKGQGMVCTPNPCPQPLGACCLNDGRCVRLKKVFCDRRQGQWQGANSTCSLVLCPITEGACCMADGSCLWVLPSVCRARGGDMLGMGTTCGPRTCPQPPGPPGGGGWPVDPDVPQPPPPVTIGACCLPSLACIETTFADCADRLGSFQGLGRACFQVYCPSAAPPGACCFSDGSCVQTTAYDCLWRGGLSQAGRTCASFACNAIAGACCLQGATCIVIDAAGCAAMSGQFGGTPSVCGAFTCAPGAGACCVPDSSCVQVTGIDCTRLGGDFRGPNSLCIFQYCPDRVNLQPCCFVNGACAMMYIGDCQSRRGIQVVGTVCSPTLCPRMGACCLPSGACFLVGEAECLSYDSAVFAADRSCNSAYCQRACPCNWNGDEWLNEGDLFVFAAAWQRGRADYNNDGRTTDEDLLNFIGCLIMPPQECQ